LSSGYHIVRRIKGSNIIFEKDGKRIIVSDSITKKVLPYASK